MTRGKVANLLHVVSSHLLVAHLPSSEINLMFFNSSSRRRKRLDRNVLKSSLWNWDLFTPFLPLLLSEFSSIWLYRYLNFHWDCHLLCPWDSHPYWEENGSRGHAQLLLCYDVWHPVVTQTFKLKAAFAPILSTWTNGTNEYNCLG